MAKKDKSQSKPKPNKDYEFAGNRVIKRFRVAREGQTVDGRTLTQKELVDMAETYDPVEYTARINVEHMSGWGGLDSSYAPALGDVVAVDCQLETFTINDSPVELMCLYATLSALPRLVEANKNGQKLFTSIEYYRKFADTGRPYLVGLAVTDIPASRGTEPLKFNTTNANTLTTQPEELILMTNKTHTTNPANTLSDNQNINPTANQATQLTDNPAESDNEASTKSENGFLTKLSNLFSKNTGMSDAEQEGVLESFAVVNESIDATNKNVASIQNQLSDMSLQLTQLTTNLSNQTTETHVSTVTGSGAELTDV